MTRTACAALLVVVSLASWAGCTSAERSTAAAARPATPPRFRSMRRIVDGGLAEAQRSDFAALRARSPALTNEGLALIKAVLPHDVARTDVPRYLEGRATFGQALKQWVRAVEAGDDPALGDALRAVDGALRGWIDAYMGMEPETSV